MTAPGAAEAAHRIVELLAEPMAPPKNEPWAAHSLAKGAAGIALLHIERAHLGLSTWARAHRWITAVTTGEVSAADNTGLHLGAPAVAFMLHAANTGSGRYQAALTAMDPHVTDLAHRRVDAAMARIHRGEPPGFHEYDALFGLTGIGAYLLHRDPHGSALGRVLAYLVALTRPARAGGTTVPGWWVAHDPHRQTSDRFPYGHGNLGAAHGVSGPLLLLARALRRDATVDGHREAIATITIWLDTWRQDDEHGPWWPEYVTLHDLHTGRTSQPRASRPSWCYGTPGIARAAQLAAIAMDDDRRRHDAEAALLACLTDPAQLQQVTDTSLCHGWAGIYQTAWRAAHDAQTPALRTILPTLSQALVRHASPPSSGGPGLLEGDAGTALALSTAAQDTAPTSGWDACLLID
jgi:lantibiotic biosynthesis protein